MAANPSARLPLLQSLPPNLDSCRSLRSSGRPHGGHLAAGGRRRLAEKADLKDEHPRALLPVAGFLGQAERTSRPVRGAFEAVRTDARRDLE